MHGASVVLVALLTSALVATGTTYLIQRYQVFPQPEVVRQVPMPELVGLPEADARSNAHALQLALLVEGREPAAGAEAGTVLRQSVKAGQSVPIGSVVGVVFAAPLPRVPKVTRLTLADARELLAGKGFKLAEGEPVASKVEPGIVVQQTPEANGELEPGGVVTVQVSSGPAEVAAPKVTGLALKAAQQKLAEAGLEARVRWISRAETVDGVVLSQKPGPGEKLAPKSAVEVVVNR